MRRVLIAVTEPEAVAELWRVAVEQMAGAPAEIVAVFVRDDRWRRAASLPFTREVSRLSGAAADFTARRAEQVDRDAATRAQERIERLAMEANRQLAFEILSEREHRRIREPIYYRQCRVAEVLSPLKDRIQPPRPSFLRFQWV